jgi:hypothetical protein
MDIPVAKKGNHMRKIASFLSGLALLILGAWLCTFNDMRPGQSTDWPDRADIERGKFCAGRR